MIRGLATVDLCARDVRAAFEWYRKVCCRIGRPAWFEFPQRQRLARGGHCLRVDHCLSDRPRSAEPFDEAENGLADIAIVGA
jgi:hypothetical protein